MGFPTPTPAVLWTLLVAFASLAVGSLVRGVAVRRADAQTRDERLASLRTWWILSLALGVAVLSGPWGVCLLLGAAGWFGIREFAALAARRWSDGWGLRVVYLVMVLHYGLICSGWHASMQVVTPLLLLLLLVTVQVAQGETVDYIKSTAGLYWGAMVLVYGLSFGALLTMLPASTNATAGPVGWFLYLVVLTEMNDIFQALSGRQFGAHGRHRIVPALSPNKTWEGFLGGLLMTMLLAVALAPLLTPWGPPAGAAASHAWLTWAGTPLAAGVLIALSGFVGDINMSAVKRDAGVKDSSRLLPGMGGMMDRVDSLTFSAPVFYYFVKWFAVS